MTAIQEVLIVSSARTPIGSFNGCLSQVPATELGSVAIREAVKRAGIEPDSVQEAIMGVVLQSGLGQAPARQAALGAGLSKAVPCTTVNKMCSSGMKAVVLGCQSVMVGANNIVVAGGMESMSNAPFYFKRGDTPYGGLRMDDAILKDGLTDAYTALHMGDCTEIMAEKMNISRRDQDEYAAASYRRTNASVAAGLLDKEITPVTIPGRRGQPDVTVTQDEDFKKVDYDKMATLKPVFKKEGGTVTAANASGINDGAAALVLMSEGEAKKRGIKGLAKVVAFADAATDPIDFGTVPTEAVNKALKKAGIGLDQITLFEINEPFSAIAIANIKMLGVSPDKVNVLGGAVALGHPIGMSGTRIVGLLALNLKPGEYGVAVICNGGGGATAMVVKGL